MEHGHQRYCDAGSFVKQFDNKNGCTCRRPEPKADESLRNVIALNSVIELIEAMQARGANRDIDIEALRKMQVYYSQFAPENEVEQTLTLTGKELRSRFIGSLENAGLDPYMFANGKMSDNDRETFTKSRCLLLGMSEAEFEGRL